MTFEANTLEVFTIGHSTLPYERFIALLRHAGVDAVADVRTSPFSRHFPQFNRDTLKSKLRLDGVSYVFLGRELGGRPRDQMLYCDGVADYEKWRLVKLLAKVWNVSLTALRDTALPLCAPNTTPLIAIVVCL